MAVCPLCISNIYVENPFRSTYEEQMQDENKMKKMEENINTLV